VFVLKKRRVNKVFCSILYTHIVASRALVKVGVAANMSKNLQVAIVDKFCVFFRKFAVSQVQPTTNWTWVCAFAACKFLCQVDEMLVFLTWFRSGSFVVLVGAHVFRFDFDEWIVDG
jgi:hypothetical protein